MHAANTELFSQSPANLKFLLNETAIVFFPATQQHRDTKVLGLSYEDDYRANALAGIVTPGHIEIRFHAAFSDERVRDIWNRVLAVPEIRTLQLGSVYYQGRKIA